MEIKAHFCNCPATDCPRHPKNHDKGCNPCIKDNLRKKKMPACFFLAVSPNVDDVSDYSIESFVDFFLKNQDEYKKDKSL